MHTLLHRRGFTLIEMLIALGLGSLLVTIAIAGLRVTAQTVTTANRMSMQNGIFRTAVIAANEEMDFWTTYDSPHDPAKQPLRAVGRPFQPLSFTTPTTSIAFNHSDPREWWNGHVWNSNNKRWGDYSIFGKQGLTDPLVPAERQWRHHILPFLANNLGYYAVVDYLPANFIFGFYPNNGTMPTEYASHIPGYGVGQFNTRWRNRSQPKSKCEASWDSGFLMTTVSSNILHPSSHRAIHSNGVPDNWHVNKLNDWSNFPSVDFLPYKPDMWPTVTIKTRVIYTFASFTHESRIALQDPLSGEALNVHLLGLTTTLRGARRQRNLDLEPVDPVYP